MTQRRFNLAMEIVRRIDTVTLATVEEVRDIVARATAGEFDEMLTEFGL